MGYLNLLLMYQLAKLTSNFISIDDTEKLYKDLQNDHLLRIELSNLEGLLVLKGERFVTLASALFHVVRHVCVGEGNPPTPPPNTVKTRV